MATILIADDNLQHLAQLRAGLEGEGHTVVEAIDGYEATEKTLAQLPDMVILGAALPIFNGYESAHILRNDPSVPRELPIVLLVSKEQDPRDLEKAGISTTLSVTYSQADLREFLSRHLGPQAA